MRNFCLVVRLWNSRVLLKKSLPASINKNHLIAMRWTAKGGWNLLNSKKDKMIVLHLLYAGLEILVFSWRKPNSCSRETCKPTFQLTNSMKIKCDQQLNLTLSKDFWVAVLGVFLCFVIWVSAKFIAEDARFRKLFFDMAKRVWKVSLTCRTYKLWHFSGNTYLPPSANIAWRRAKYNVYSSNICNIILGI